MTETPGFAGAAGVPGATATAAPSAGAAALEARIRALANEIVDPCSAAPALPVGRVDRGLLLAVELDAAAGAVGVPGAWPAPAGGPETFAVRLRLRTTGPGCFYVVFFERELRARLEALPAVATLALEWDDAWDWSPAALAPHVQEALAERRRRLIATIPVAPKARR